MISGIQWQPAGYAALSGPIASCFDDLDRLFLGWAKALHAEEHYFPSFIALKDLKPLAYLRSFPHLVTFAGTVPDDKQILSDFAATNGDAEVVAFGAEGMAVTELLTPAACYHFYHRLARCELEGDLFLTTRCPCHRREKHYKPLERQWCFHMRELVCIGTAETVDNFIQHCRERIECLVQTLRINTRWKIASDPFFDPIHDPKALAQMLEPVKQELVLDDGLAIASINRHRSFFGECYGIRCNGEYARSACVAFGLERWLAALARQFGDNPALWPAIREKIH